MHLTTEFPPLVYGGLGTAVGGLAGASARCGIDIAILLVGTDGDPSYPRLASDAAVAPATERPSAQPGICILPAPHDAAEATGILHARRWRPDILHLHSFWLWPVAEAIRERTGVPIVYTVHSLDRAEYEIGQGPPECLTQWHIQQRAIACADAIVALTRAERDLIEAYVPGSLARTHVVGNGIDVSQVPLDAGFPWQRSRREVVILFSGRFVDRKGLQELLAATPALLQGRPELRIVLAGGYRGCDGEDLARRWAGPALQACRDRLHFPGWLDAQAMAAWYREADVLVVPSWYEPFGMVVLEGMLHGLAIAASDIGGPHEILDDERTGLLFAPRDASALGVALGRLADSEALRHRLGRAAAEEVRQRWSLEKIVTRMAAVYDRTRLAAWESAAFAQLRSR